MDHTGLVFVISVLVTASITILYQGGAVSLKVTAVVAGLGFCGMIGAASMAPPSEPLTCEEMVKRKAEADGYVVGLASGMMMPR